MRALVKEYILVKGNREAAEILKDYVKHHHNLSDVIRDPQSKLRSRTNAQEASCESAAE